MTAEPLHPSLTGDAFSALTPGRQQFLRLLRIDVTAFNDFVRDSMLGAPQGTPVELDPNSHVDAFLRRRGHEAMLGNPILAFNALTEAHQQELSDAGIAPLDFGEFAVDQIKLQLALPPGQLVQWNPNVYVRQAIIEAGSARAGLEPAGPGD